MQLLKMRKMPKNRGEKNPCSTVLPPEKSFVTSGLGTQPIRVLLTEVRLEARA